MAWEARSGLKRLNHISDCASVQGLNGLGSPFGIETAMHMYEDTILPRLNGLGSPFGIETHSHQDHTPNTHQV